MSSRPEVPVHCRPPRFGLGGEDHITTLVSTGWELDFPTQLLSYGLGPAFCDTPECRTPYDQKVKTAFRNTNSCNTFIRAVMRPGSSGLDDEGTGSCRSPVTEPPWVACTLLKLSVGHPSSEPFPMFSLTPLQQLLSLR